MKIGNTVLHPKIENSMRKVMENFDDFCASNEEFIIKFEKEIIEEAMRDSKYYFLIEPKVKTRNVKKMNAAKELAMIKNYLDQTDPTDMLKVERLCIKVERLCVKFYNEHLLETKGKFWLFFVKIFGVQVYKQNFIQFAEENITKSRKLVKSSKKSLKRK